VRSPVDDDLPADELVAVEDLVQDEVAGAQQDCAVGGAEQPGQPADGELMRVHTLGSPEVIVSETGPAK
jgi:hypothetical protein